LSLVEAEVTLVAAEATARGVTAVVRTLVVRTPVARLAVLGAVLAAPLAPAVLAAPVVFVAPAGFAAPEVFAVLAVLVVRARELALTALAVRTGAVLAAAFFVGGTDLPPI
jgi:hypothetical protein